MEAWEVLRIENVLNRDRDDFNWDMFYKMASITNQLEALKSDEQFYEKTMFLVVKWMIICDSQELHVNVFYQNHEGLAEKFDSAMCEVTRPVIERLEALSASFGT